jgi:hypothetical protein
MGEMTGCLGSVDVSGDHPHAFGGHCGIHLASIITVATHSMATVSHALKRR